MTLRGRPTMPWGALASYFAVLGLAAGGCSADDSACGTGPPGRTKTPLVSSDLWVTEAAPEDPLADHRPEAVQCSSIGAYPEGPAFEVQTDDCNYAGFVQPALAAAYPGDRIAVEASHLDLVAPEPATAHVAVLLGARVVWEQMIEIPNDPRPYSAEVEVDDCVEEGTPVRFHLHNHGYNTWKLLSVELVPDGV